ncbi:GNAT family N-acetyltransferase [Streptococcus hongkongensis]
MPTYELKIEEAQPSDAQAIQELLRSISLESHFLSEMQAILDIDAKELGQSLERLAQRSDSICLLAKVNNQLIGLVNMSTGPYDDTNHISELFIAVDKRFRGQGLGKELMALGLDWAQQTESIRKIELEVQVANKAAIKLYQSFDFVIEGQRRFAVKSINGNYSDAYLMGKLLNK